MNVASLENCKRLYELSGWRQTAFVYEDDEVIALFGTPNQDMSILPAYDLGYLLRKLPPQVFWKGAALNLELVRDSFGSDWIWIAEYGDNAPASNYRLSAHSDDDASRSNPEDAACLLAIKLFEEAVL